jgi:hypothetical protein
MTRPPFIRCKPHHFANLDKVRRENLSEIDERFERAIQTRIKVGGAINLMIKFSDITEDSKFIIASRCDTEDMAVHYLAESANCQFCIASVFIMPKSRERLKAGAGFVCYLRWCVRGEEDFY